MLVSSVSVGNPALIDTAARKGFSDGANWCMHVFDNYAQPLPKGFAMPFFKELTDITEPANYVNELKAAFKSSNGKKFAYFYNHPKCPKRPHVLLVDYDVGIAKLLGGTPKAEGKVIITENEEISFEMVKGAMKIRPLKAYIEKFYKTRPILVPINEPEGEENVIAPDVQAPNTANLKPNETNITAAPKPPPGPPPSQPPPPTPQAAAPGQQTAPKLDTRMDKKIAFEENAFKRRQLLARVQELQSAPFPSDLATLKKSSLEKARELAEKDNFTEAEILLNGLAAKLRTLPSRPPPPPLSAYMKATTQWKSAKTTAEDGVFKLKKAILEACDPELKDAVKAKIDGVNSILAPLDDVILKKIDEARSDSDDERRAVREQAIGKLATERLQSLRQHPLAGVADSNPFGNFTIRAPMEQFLTQIATTFGV